MSANSGTRGVRTWLAVVHGTLGLSLGAFAILHGVQNYPAVNGADAWVERALHTALGFGFGMFVLAVLALHGVLGVARWFGRRADAARTDAPRDWGSTFQLVTGVFVALFIAYHVHQLWPSGSGMHSSLREPYARMWETLGRPLPLLIYVAGVTAVAFHLGHGLARLLSRARSRMPNVVARTVGGVLGFVLLLMFVQIVARFAVGEALIPALS